MCNWGDGEPWLWARGVAHLWRTTRDILDAYRKPDSRWSLDMLTIFRENVVLADHAAPGGFNDPDMLEIGNGHMTATEYRTHMSLWCLMAAPLLIGCDLRTMSAETRAILGQRDLIAIDQDALGRQARLARREGELYTLVKPLQDGGAAVGLFNAGDVAMEVRLSWSELLGDGPRRAREIWADADARERMVQGQESLTVAAHATRVWRVAPQGAAMR
jgi:alpha-galactosidase